MSYRMPNLLALAVFGPLCAVSFAFVPAHHNDQNQNSHQTTLPTNTNTRTYKANTVLYTSISTTVVTSGINEEGDENTDAESGSILRKTPTK